MAVQFAKYEGLGNDFVVIESSQIAIASTIANVGSGLAQSSVATAQAAAQHVTGATSHEAISTVFADKARALCDRHRGIGADGVLVVDVGPEPLRMRVINADGSQPEMCGNGLRCVALHLVRRGFAPAETEFSVETGAGPHVCRVGRIGREGSLGQVEVSMRPPSLVPSEVPVLASGERPLLDEPFEVDGTQIKLSCVSMGNPHAVTFDESARAARARLGPSLEKHARFPNAANIGFAKVVGAQRLELAVWERGVGFTEACGTGACACAVAAVETGRAARHELITVELPGGPLQIRVGEPGDRILMIGPARHVFDGSLASLTSLAL